MNPRPFTWWWPSTSVGVTAFWIVIVLSSLTFFIAGPFAIINVAFWYFAAVFVRFVFLQATGQAPKGP